MQDIELQGLEKLVATMRANGVRVLKMGDIHLELGPLPGVPDAKPDAAEAAAEREKDEERGPDGLTKAEAEELYYST